MSSNSAEVAQRLTFYRNVTSRHNVAYTTRLSPPLNPPTPRPARV